MANRGEVLVAIINSPENLALAREQHWYHIPVRSVERRLKRRWPPKWVAFYQTKVFGREAYAVNYYARVRKIRQVPRKQLFPDVYDERRDRSYYQILLDPLQELPHPIPSHRWRRIVFIPTTWEKFSLAVEINDLYDESPLEDRLWAVFKRWQISAERQAYITVKMQNYVLDFAIYCMQGKLDVETDGDSWHAHPGRAAHDNLRDNALETVGWRVLRFNTMQVREQTEEYCLPTVVENIDTLGGLKESELVSRRVDLDLPPGSRQLSLFEPPKEAETTE